MTKITIEREVLHQMACRSGGGRGEFNLPAGLAHKIALTARQIANATAIPENGPVELVVTE